MGMSLDEVILRSTWNPAKEIQHEELGNLSVGSPADVAVLRLEKGKFGFVDQIGGAPRRHAEAGLRADGARRQGGLRPERDDARDVGQDPGRLGGAAIRGGTLLTSAGRGGANAKGGDQKKK